MSVGTTAALVMGGIGAAGSIGSALIGGHAASTAAGQEAGAAQAGIDETQREFNQTQANLAPYLQAGGVGLSLLQNGIQSGALTTPFGETYQQPAAFSGGPAFDPGVAFSYGAFNAPAPFTAPTLDNTNDPGYQFRLQQGQQALTRGAAASGGAFSGGTMQALARYGQDYASNEYQNVYNRALQGYQTNFNNSLAGYQTNFNNALQGYQTNFGNRLNAYNSNFANALAGYNTNVNTGLAGYNTRLNAYNTGQANQFQRLLALAGMGQGAAGSLGQFGANNSAAIANLLGNKGMAQAGGTLGTGQALNAGLTGVTGNPFLTGGIMKYLTGGTGAAGSEGPTYTGMYSGGDYLAGDPETAFADMGPGV